MNEIALAVRLGDRLITHEVRNLSFRKEAVGGVRSITFDLPREIGDTDPNLAFLTRVYLTDAATGNWVAEGRISDTGRTVDDFGTWWRVACFGAVKHAADTSAGHILQDRQLARWDVPDENSHERMTLESGEWWDATWSEFRPKVLMKAEIGHSVAAATVARISYRALVEIGFKLGGCSLNYHNGLTDSNYFNEVRFRSSLADAGAVQDSNTASTSGTTRTLKVTTNFAADEAVLEYQFRRGGSSITAASSHWGKFYLYWVAAQRYNANGTVNTTGSSYNETVLIYQIIQDLLGRRCPEYDGTNASIYLPGTDVDQWAFSSPRTTEELFNEASAHVVDSYWTVGKSDLDSNKYAFTWGLYPSEIRYAVPLDDTANFPASVTEVYNSVAVRWVDAKGRTRTYTQTWAQPELDAAGLIRQAEVVLGDEVGSTRSAWNVADVFEAEHKIPDASGTMTISRPIFDRVLGRYVEPHEIEPGSLIHISGLADKQDSLESATRNGYNVFRIWALDWTDGTATLELSSRNPNVANIVSTLVRKRRAPK